MTIQEKKCFCGSMDNIIFDMNRGECKKYREKFYLQLSKKFPCPKCTIPYFYVKVSDGMSKVAKHDKTWFNQMDIKEFLEPLFL